MTKKSRKITPEEEDEIFTEIVKEKHNNSKDFLASIKVDVKPKTLNQKKLIKEIKSKEIVICAGLAGTGKAQPLDALILTPNGYVKMGDLNKNDEVLTPFNGPSKIVEIFPQGVIDIYRVVFSDGTSTECCGNHLWSVLNHDEPLTTIQIINTLTLNKKERNSNFEIPITKPINFNEKDENLDYYSFGFSIGCKTTPLQENIEIEIPNEYLLSSAENRIKLLQGLIDGSGGYINIYTNSFNLNTISLKLSDNIQFIVESLGGISTVNINYSTDYVTFINSIQLPIEIKFTRNEDFLDHLSNTHKEIKRFIMDIIYIGKKESQCLLIEDEDHLYLTNNFIVTHNTFISCATAIELLKSDSKYKKIVIVKSVTTLKNEEIGFLKGSMKDKMEPFMYSFTHNFNKIVGKPIADLLQNAGIIEELPIAYMRGINIDNSIVIIDEAQNISIDNIRTIMTRLGENSKMIFLGDEYQIDMSKKSDSSLTFIMNKFENFDEVGTIRMTEDDIIRNPLIKKIEAIFRENNAN